MIDEKIDKIIFCSNLIVVGAALGFIPYFLQMIQNNPVIQKEGMQIVMEIIAVVFGMAAGTWMGYYAGVKRCEFEIKHRKEEFKRLAECYYSMQARDNLLKNFKSDKTVAEKNYGES